MQKVEDALNEITMEKINVHVNLTMMEMGNYMTQMPMQITAGDKMDLISTFPAGSGTFLNMMSSHQLLPLDDLLEEYCQDMLELMPENYFDSTRMDGQVYAVPIYADKTTDIIGFAVNRFLTKPE